LSSIGKPPFRYSSFASGLDSFGEATTVIDNGVGDFRGPLGLNLLHAPSVPLIDFIFVHGLGGGSRKTWSKTNSVTHYWPQEWLPKDPAFKNVRIHSFGYNSDWVKGKDSCLNIHHFGKSFLGEISTSPYLGDAETPIVFVGHSMGGLVIKKTYMLARQDATYETLAKRFHTIYFLATPHRGCASAKLLSNVLQAAYSSRAYVADLKQSSGAIQAINDEFRNYSADIDLWSFYETQKLKMGVFSALIVDPDSAILGYREEKQMPMNADHRSICKFDTITDPNYLIIRNALASTVNGISKTGIAYTMRSPTSLANEFVVTKSKEKLWRSQIKDLEKYLGVSGKLEDDLVIADDARLPGTCEWLSKKDTYLKWKIFAPDSPSVLWITGKPAAGKSVLAGYAVDQLQRTSVDCSYFFFKYGDKSKSRLGACLRSMAFQMACTNAQVRDTLLEMQQNDIRFDKDNERTIWRKLFLSGIFETEFPRHYWVIDALDECVNTSALFDLMLPKLDGSTPLRILITSRETSELEKSFMTLGTHRFQSERISTANTFPDIKLLVEAKAKTLVVKDDNDRAALVEKILAKSKGSFLWTVLVLKELSNSYSEEEVNQVLEDVPRGMEALYQRALESISQATRGKKVANAILTWATCATRPLTTDELDGALKLDVKIILPKVEEAIVALCGQLVTVDKFGKVQMVHETAREFLLNDNFGSEFVISKRDAHTRIARACLTYLTGEEMRPPRSGRRFATTTGAHKREGFPLYACEAFSYHLSKSDPLENDILVLIHKFLESNVLSWIEVIAQTQNLIPLIRSAKNLRTYLNACAAARSPLGKEMQIIRGWTTDLIRIVAKFGDALIMSPSAIFSLVLPFCPTESTVYSIAKPGRRLSVVGLSNTHWDDRISCIDLPQGKTSAVCYGDEFLAVGLTTGTIALYHTTSFQEYKVLNHGEAVKLLEIKSKTDLIASCGIATIRIWDIRSGQIIHNFQAPPRSICLTFDKNFLIVASQKNYLASWNLDNDGAQEPDRPWNDSGEHRNTLLRRPPRAMSISVGHKMLAVAYSGQPITLWDLEADAYYGTCGKKLPNGEPSTHVVSAVVFNPNINIALLAVSYLDGELVLLDPFTDQELESFRANCHTLAASPDGRLLAGGAGSGIIKIYEFDTLRLLYQVKSSDIYIKQLAFSRDNLHFADIKGSQCNIWEPAVLLRDLIDDSSEGTSTSVIEGVAQETKIKISAMILHPNGEVVFCGKEDGSVSAYDVETAAQLRTLYLHKSLVRILVWWPQADVIMSVDASNGIFAWKLKKTQQEGWVAEKMQLQARLDCGRSITQVLLNEAVGKFVLSTRESDHLWSIDGQQEGVLTYPNRPGIRKWIQHPQSPLHMICIDGAAARIYAWSDWSETACLPLSTDTKGLQLKAVISYRPSHRQQILLELSELDGSASTRALKLLDGASFSIAHELVMDDIAETALTKEDFNRDSIKAGGVDPVVLSPLLVPLAHRVAHVIGLHENGKIIFLDTHSWVCSTDLKNLGNSSISYVRHFFVPYDWLSGTREIICAILKRNVLFARNDDVLIIKGGLEHVEMVEEVHV
jgi:WD40 repeat protein